MEEENELIDQEEIFDPESLLLTSENETEEEEEELSELDKLLVSNDFSFKASNPRETKKPLIPVDEIVNDKIQNSIVIPTNIGEVIEPVNYRKTEEGVYYQPDKPEDSEFFVQTEKAKAKIEEAVANPVYTDDYVISVGEFDLFKDLDRESFRKIDIAATQENINNANILYTPDIVTAKEINKLRIGETPQFNVSENEELDTTKYYTPTENVKKYIMDSIYQQMNLESAGSFTGIEDFEGTWEDFVEMSARVNEKIIGKDPIIQEIFANSAINLRNESTRKYIDLLNESLENGNLDDPARLELVEKQFQQWQKTRWQELLAESDYSQRAQQYTFALKATLGDLYQRFARGQEEDLSEIDEQLRTGEIDETWWGLKDIAIGMKRGFGKKYKQLGLVMEKPFNQLSKEAVKSYEKIEELELENLTLQQLNDLYNSNITDEYKEAIEGLYNSFPQALKTGIYSDPTKKNQTIKELTGKSREDISEKQEETFKTAISVLEDQRFESILNDIDMDESGIADTIGQIIQQSNMLLTFAGEGIASLGKQSKSLPGMAVYGTGKLMSLLGTLDIATSEFTSQIFGTFDERIKQRKGENYTPTVEDLMVELEDPESVSIIQNLLTTGAIVGLERLGIAKALGATKIGSKNFASLLRGEFKQFIKGLPAFIYQREIAGLTEFFTEGTQGFISDVSIRKGAGQTFLDSVSEAEFDQIGAEKGRQIGRFLPVVGKITQQSAIELNTAALKIADNFNLTKLAPTFANTERFFNQAIEKIKKDIADGNISEDVGQENIRQLSNIRNAGLKIPANIDGRSKKRLTRLLIEKKNLKDKIEEINDKDISANDLLRLAEISIDIQSIVEKGDRKEKFNKQVGNITNIINNNPDAKVKIIRSKDEKGVEKQLEKLREEGWKIAASKGLTTNYGTIFQKGDQQVIVLNNKEIMKDGAINTAAHEFLHAVLWNTVRNSKGTAIALGNDLVKYLNEIDPSLMKNSELAKRVQQYKDDPNVSNEQQAEEVLTLFSEAVLDGAIELKADYVQDVLDFFNNLWQRFTGNNNIRFDSGRDVFKFIKDYNKSVQSGKFTKAQQKLFTERATGKLVKREYTTQEMRNRDVAVEKSSKKLTELTTEYKEGNFDNVEELSTQYQKTGKDALKRWAAQRGVSINLGNPQVDQEVTSLLNKEFDSFTRNFDSSKAQASTYMENIAKRIGPKIVEEATRKGKQVSQDVLTEKGVSPEVSVQPDIDQKQAPTGQRAKVFPNAIRVISDTITGETRAEQKAMLKNDIQEAILRVGTNPKAIAQYIVEKTKTKEYRALIKAKLGRFGSQQYIDNVYKLFNNKDFIKAIPVANIKRRFGKLFGIKQIDTVKTKKVEDGKTTYFDKQVYSIPAITSNSLNKIRQYFLAGEKRSQSLFEIIGEGIAVESMQELRMDKDFMKELQNRLDFKKSNLTAVQFMDQVEFNLDKRNLEDTSFDQVKANKKRKSSLNVQDYQRIELLIKNNPKTLLKNNNFTPYPAGGSNSFSTEQKKERNQAVLRLLPKFGLDFFNSYGWFKNSSAVFKDKVEFDNFMDQALDVEFVKDNPAFINKHATKKGNQYFLNKKSFPKQGPALTKSQWKTLKKARTEQAEYATLSRSKRADKLRDKNFRKLQDNKVEILRKIINAIDKDVRDSDGNIIAKRFEFYAAWLESQANVSTHSVRVLSPIRFFSTSNLPFRETTNEIDKLKGSKYTFEDGTPIYTEGTIKNYEAEHMLPVNNVTRLILDMIINNNVNKDFEFIANNSIQGQLLKSDDNIITKAGYQIKLPRDFFNMKKPNPWIRYLLGNPEIDLNSYIMFDANSNKIITVAESLGLPLAKEDQNSDSIHYQNKLLIRVLAPEVFPDKDVITIKKAKELLKDSDTVNKKSSKQVKNNKQNLYPLINPKGNTEASIQAISNADKAIQEANKYSKKRKGISVFDFDDTLAFSNSKVIVTLDGKTFKITPAEFANQAADLELNGASFNFSEFNKVIKGRKGPLADLALKRQEKFGSGDIFVLTARPQLSAVAIKKFLDGIGLNIPIENITGLENGSPEAKALWVVDKAANGYNDFYFADDALPNVLAVKNVLSQIDVKSKVQQAKASKKRNIDKEFNIIIEQQSGKKWFKEYSNARAKVEGKKSNRFEFFIPPSAEDFVGLMYKILPKGEKGNLALRWINDNLLDPFNKAEQSVISAKMAVANDFNALRESLDNIPTNLMEESGYSNFTWSQALRVYIWNMQGNTIPGLSNRDRNALIKLIEKNSSMKVFAEKIAFIQKGKSYPSPQKNWVAGSITSDIINGIQKVYRKEALAEWQQNVDIIFSEKNMNKLEALYGSNYIVALKNILGRMKRGSNRAFGGNPQVDNVIDWVNNSVGTTMFLNRKSALLQLISNVNFLNWSDNNIYEAGKAFANQPQYWKDVMYLLNSDYLVQRRNGLKINVAESEIAEAAQKGGFKGAISYLLNKGFVFTRYADSFAIATGGATFYRNRFNKLQTKVNPETGKLYTKKEAADTAFNDFYKISEETQQSSRTDRISMQQASGLGRVVLNYANTPMQYARIIKKSSQDLLAGRGDWRSNVSKILYYGFVQNLIFNGLQQALFALAFGEEEEQKKAQSGKDRAEGIAFGMLSTLLRGLGYGGALVDTLISMGREISIKEDGLPSFSEDFAWNVFDFSPTVDTKVRKLRAVRKTFVYNREEIKRRGFNLENPAYYSLAQVIDAGLNIPLDRALRMAMSLKQISDRETATWQRFALALGWSSWSVGLPYWGTLTTVGEEAAEDAAIKEKYTNDSRKLKGLGYKRIPMTRGKPEGKVNIDFIEVTRPSGDIEYWIIPKMKIK